MRRPAPVISFVALVLTLSSAYFLIEPTPTTKLLLYNSVGALSVGAVVRSIIRLPRSRRVNGRSAGHIEQVNTR